MIELQVGKTYRMVFPNNTVTTARLDKIERYPIMGFPPDYVFQYIKGDDTLPKASKLPEGQFSLPVELISKLKNVEEY